MSNNTSVCPDSDISTTPTAAVKVAAYSLIFVISTIGNLLVIVVVGKNRHLRSASINQLIMSLALADLLTSCFNMTVEIWIYAKEAAGQHFVWFDGSVGVVFCKLVVFLQGISVACSVLTLTAIAVNRFFAVFFPLKRMGFSSNSLSGITIGLIWLVSCTIASPMLYAMKVVEQDGNLQCTEQWSPAFDEETSRKTYTLVLLVLLYALPLGVISVLYTAVVRKVWRRQVPGNIIAPNQLVELITKKRVLRMLMTVVVVFGLCWLPYYVYLLLNFIVSDFPQGCTAPKNVIFIGLFLGHANSAINPCIYAIFNKEYRNGFLTSLHCACLSTLQGSQVPRNFNQSSVRRTQLGADDMSLREQRRSSFHKSKR